jgi:hypothetical protein
MIATPTIAQADEDARRRVLQLLLHERHEAVLVDSPPGAGKTDLVEMAAALAASGGARVLVVAFQNEQVYDLVRRLSADYPVPVTLIHSAMRPPPADLAVLTSVTLGTRVPDLPGSSSITVMTVKKAATMVPDLVADEFDLLVCDEAYQVTYKDLMVLLHLAPRRLLVGDPGQLSPLVRGDLARYEAARHKVHWAAPRELLRKHPGLPRVALPATWRFPQDTVDLVQPAFYPTLPFSSGPGPAERRLAFRVAGVADPVDRALNLLADGASVVAVVLPPSVRDLSESDRELAEVSAHLVARMLERSPEWVGVRGLAQDDIGYVDAHVASNEQARTQLRRQGVGAGTLTNTPEVWQGLQRPIMVAKHTLSGISEPSSFELVPGRLSVMTSRHQLGMVIVSRDGIGAALEGHKHDTTERPVGSEDEQFAGWRAHVELWNRLEQLGRIVRL